MEIKSSRQQTQRSFVIVCLLCFVTASVSGWSYPKAQNLTWVSINFKTILTWSPTPTNYSYTVEYSKIGGDNQRTADCIQINKNECDLTPEFTDLKSKYEADVLSDVPRGMPSDLIEFVRTNSDRFCPYTDTTIDSPKFKIELSKDKRKTTLYVEDIQTAVLDAQNRPRTIQDIFKNDLEYLVTYKKAKSSGKKETKSTFSVIELTNLDEGESYCFTVQVYIPSRGTDKQHSETSQVQCFTAGDTSIFDVYGIPVIAGGILLIIIIISVVIAVIVICCKRQQKAKNRGKERVPLKGV